MTAVKYTFDNDFEDNSTRNSSQKKLDDMREAAFEEGLNSGRQEAHDSINNSCKSLLENILAAGQKLADRQDEQMVMMNKETARLAYAIVEKLAPALVERTPMAEIELLVNQCLRNSPLEPRLVIRVDDSILPTLQEKLDDIKLASSYPGKIVLLSEPMSHMSNCRVEWANGGVERDFSGLMRDVEDTVKLFIDASETGNISENSQSDPDTGTISETITQ